MVWRLDLEWSNWRHEYLTLPGFLVDLYVLSCKKDCTLVCASAWSLVCMSTARPHPIRFNAHVEHVCDRRHKVGAFSLRVAASSETVKGWSTSTFILGRFALGLEN